MSSNTDQPEPPNGSAAPDPGRPSDSDPDLHQQKDDVVQSEVAPPAADDDEANSIAIKSNECQSDCAKDSQSHGKPSQSDVAGVHVVPGLDPKLQHNDDRNDQSIGSTDNGAKLNRTFTMRELLDELKKDDGSEEVEGGTPLSQASSKREDLDHNNPAMDLINRVTGNDDEGRSRQRILMFAAKRYARAIERNPADYEAFYSWALVLQENADNLGPGSDQISKDLLLEEACKKYEEATQLSDTLYDAYYNWAIAISDRAKMRGRTKEAEEFWKQATRNYEKAVQLNWNSPQALNNWGLALQELSAIVPAREKQTIVKTAINKFRASIQLQFDFHRAIYNLGTVLYALAEDTSRAGGSNNAKYISADELYSQSAIYIAGAHALKPNSSIYSSALKLVRSMLPLPYLKVGYLIAPPVGNPIAPHSDWKRSQFILNHEGLQQINKAEQRHMMQSLPKSGDITNSGRAAIRVNIPDIVSVSACADLTLPPGAGLCIDTIYGPVFLVADSWVLLEGWLDAIRLVYTIFARGKSDVLAGIISG